MDFKTKLSTKQFCSIILLIIGAILFWGAFYGTSGDKEFLLKLVSLSIIIISISNFFDEITKRRRIRRATNNGNYDSGGETEIANFFKKRKIIFELHPVLKLPKSLWIMNIPFSYHEIRPDFYLPEYNIYVEYWGMINNEEYKEKTYKPKKELYNRNMIDLINLYPKNLENLDRDFNQKLLEIIRDRGGNSKEWR
ncbi:MAG: hypothetical protein AABY32_00335 [Nanoarchaeota archaeon]